MIGLDKGNNIKINSKSDTKLTKNILKENDQISKNANKITSNIQKDIL